MAMIILNGIGIRYPKPKTGLFGQNPILMKGEGIYL